MEKMVYTKTAAERILGRKIEKLEVWNAVWVKPKEGKPTLVSKKRFLRDFEESRREKSHDYCTVRQNKEDSVIKFNVTKMTEENGYRKFYTCLVGRGPKVGKVECECKDWKSIKAAGINGPVCKHLYACLRDLGYSSLNDLCHRTWMKSDKDDEDDEY